METIKNKAFSSRRKQNAISALVLVLPAVISMLVFLIGPMIFALTLSFQQYNFLNPAAAKFVGIQNFVDLFHDPIFIKALGNTFKFSFAVVPLQTVFALLLATIANQKIKGKSFFRVVYYLPSITSAVAVATIFMFLFNRNGIANQFLSLFGVAKASWFASPQFALPLIIIMAVWASVGSNMIIFLAGLQEIPDSLYESSKVDGASAIQQFFYITLPMLRHQTFFVVIIGFIGTLQVFDQAFIISRGQGGPLNSTMTVVLYLYRKAFSNNEVGYASAMAMVLFILIFALTLIQRKIFDRSET